MKNKITLSIAISLSIAFISLIGTTTAYAQSGGNLQLVAETGLVLIEPGELLVLTVKPKTGHAQVIEVESCSFSRGAGPGGGPHVKLTCDVRRASVEADGAYSFEFRGSDTIGGFSCDISSSRPNRVAVQGQMHRIVTENGQQKKLYTGHVTLLKQ